MGNFFQSKATILALLAFVAIVILSVGPWRESLVGTIQPPVPQVSEIYLGTSPPEGDWQFVVSDQLISDCAVAYVYSFDQMGVLEVYELDSGTLEAVGFSGMDVNCTGSVVPGYLAVNFTKEPGILSIVVWVSKTPSSGADVYFTGLGSWKFIEGSYKGYVPPSMGKDYLLLPREDVLDMINATGIHYINR